MILTVPTGLELAPVRTALLKLAIAQVGLREATGKNDGDVLKFVPKAYHGQHLPYCAWTVGWLFHETCGQYPYDGRWYSGAWQIYNAGKAAGEKLELGAKWPALGPQPGDIFIVLHDDDNNDATRSPGHAGIVFNVSEDGKMFNGLEGNFQNGFGMSQRAFKDVDGVFNPYARLAPKEHKLLAFERKLLSAPKGGASLVSTR